MNLLNSDEPDEFAPRNRLSEYFQQMDRESASGQNDPAENDGNRIADDEANRESDADSDYLESEGVLELGNPDFAGSSTDVESRYSPEDMLTPQFFDACYRSHLKGHLQDFLSALGLGSAENVATVESLFDQKFPNFHDESDHLLGMVEQELAQVCLGGATRVGDFTDDGFALDTKTEEKRFRAMELLTFVRLKRLELHSKRSE